MEKAAGFIKKELVFCIAAMCAAISMLIVPPDGQYFGYIDWKVLAQLFCLMSVTAGLRDCGALTAFSRKLTGSFRSVRGVAAVIIAVTFFASMLVTNDVALLTLVPVLLAALSSAPESTVIFAVVLQTAAANMGSLATPMGNPQNLYLYAHYGLDAGAFFAVTLPLAGLSAVMLAALALLIKNAGLTAPDGEAAPVDKRRMLKFFALFVLCLLSVFRVMDWRLLMALMCLALLITDRVIFKKADYMLLLTFICFFVFSGNVARMEPVREFIAAALGKSVWAVSAAVSQVISNVPAAVMLSAFTDDAQGLLTGTNMGGLGTIVASLASLISYKIYSARREAKKGRYMLIFSAVNFGMLTVLFIVYTL